MAGLGNFHGVDGQKAQGAGHVMQTLVGRLNGGDEGSHVLLHDNKGRVQACLQMMALQTCKRVTGWVPPLTSEGQRQRAWGIDLHKASETWQIQDQIGEQADQGENADGDEQEGQDLAGYCPYSGLVGCNGGACKQA